MRQTPSVRSIPLRSLRHFHIENRDSAVARTLGGFTAHTACVWAAVKLCCGYSHDSTPIQPRYDHSTTTCKANKLNMSIFVAGRQIVVARLNRCPIVIVLALHSRSADWRTASPLLLYQSVTLISPANILICTLGSLKKNLA